MGNSGAECKTKLITLPQSNVEDTVEGCRYTNTKDCTPCPTETLIC